MRIIAGIELLELKNDIVFQEMFGKQKNSKITAHLISLILGREVKNINLDLNKRMLGNRIDSKTGRLDVRAKFNDGEDCNIELQVLPYKYMDKRLLEYWASMYTAKIDTGNDYDVLKPCISILITNYKIKQLEEIGDYQTVWNLREAKHPEKILTKDIEMHVLEIPKIKKSEIATDELALWLKFIENPVNREVQKNMYKQENKYLKQAEAELKYLSGDPDFKRLIDARAGFLRDQQAFENKGIEVGIARGRAEGQKIEKMKIAKKLLDTKMPIEQISQITGLTEDEIKKI